MASKSKSRRRAILHKMALRATGHRPNSAIARVAEVCDIRAMTKTQIQSVPTGYDTFTLKAGSRFNPGKQDLSFAWIKSIKTVRRVVSYRAPYYPDANSRRKADTARRTLGR